MRTAVRLLLGAVVLGGIVFLFLLPARTWMSQSRTMSVEQRRAALLSQENAALANRVSQLKSTNYIEQVARQQYGLVMPGEKAYGILLPTATTTTTTTTAHPAPHG